MTVCYCMKQTVFSANDCRSLLLRLEDDCLLPLAPTLLGDFSFNEYCETTLFMFWVGEMWVCHLTILTFFIILLYRDSIGTNFMCHCNLHFCVFSQAFFLNFCFIGIAEGFVLRVSFQCTLLC
jgi:hypothetical protein